MRRRYTVRPPASLLSLSTLCCLLAALVRPAAGQTPASPAPAADSLVHLASPPALLGERTVSTDLSEFAAAVIPGEALYFTVTDGVFSRMTILWSRWSDGRWQPPEVASFSGVWNDGDPGVSPDGRRLYFMSNRPTQGEAARRDFDLWYVERTRSGGWSEPRHVPAPINDSANISYPSVAADGTLYYQRDAELWHARPRAGGSFATPEPLALGGRFAAPAVSPDHSLLVVVGGGAAGPRDLGDLFVSTRTETGWSTPRRLAPTTNSPSSETAPSFSTDGRTLYFSSDRAAFGQAAWPRARRVGTVAEIRAELQAVTLNGQRNIWAVEVGDLAARLRAGAARPPGDGDSRR